MVGIALAALRVKIETKPRLIPSLSCDAQRGSLILQAFRCGVSDRDKKEGKETN